MADIIFGDHSPAEPVKELAGLFSNDLFSGTLYLGYPILNNASGAVRIDALYVSEEYGVVAFDFQNYSITHLNEEAFDAIKKVQDNLYAAISSKLYETPELMNRRKLVIDVQTVSVSATITDKKDGVIISIVDNIINSLERGDRLSPDHFRHLNSTIERTATIRPKKKRTEVSNLNSKGGKIKEIEKQIANLDAWQKKAAIESPLGPQRIRGLAGSGKTIVLALKAAYIHSKEPNARIAVTFQTRSLYQQFRRLIRQFCFEFSKAEPDWDKLVILHAWGSSASKGVYSEVCRAVNLSAMDFAEAKAKFGMAGAFKGACNSLLQHLRSQPKPTPIFDVVLIDEAQDLPQAFFEVIFHVTSPPKRIVYAYDELQNLSENTMTAADDLFGKKANGQPNIRIRNEEGKPRQDIVLPVCYRNTPWALTVAHGLGFGIARSSGLVQMFDGRDVWNDIGYEVSSGTLSPGKAVALRRKPTATPQFFNELLTSNEAIVFNVFDDIDAEQTWVAEQISSDIRDGELELDDILIVVPEAIAVRTIAPGLMAKLRKLKISSHLVGVTNSRDEVFAPDSVAITSIYRAKGNEAPMVYVVGSHYCDGGFNLAQKRNILFTAITRSRAWVRVTGVGASMQNIAAEYQKIVADDFELRLNYPTSAELKRITTLNKDRSEDELRAIQGEIEVTTRLLKRLSDGEISLESLPAEFQSLVNPKI